MYKAFNVMLDQAHIDHMISLHENNQSFDAVVSQMSGRYEPDPMISDLVDSVIDVDTLLTDELEKIVFPESKLDVFISHSHADAAMAEGFADWLKEEFNLSVFVDSRCWRHTDDIKYELKKRIGFRYRDTSGLDDILSMVLVGAIMKAIDNCEAFFFLNTKNSLKDADLLGKEHTESPWLYYELMCSRFLRTKYTSSRGDFSERRSGIVTDSLKPSFKADVGGLIPLDSNRLRKWKCLYKTNVSKPALATLYDIASDDLTERRPLFG